VFGQWFGQCVGQWFGQSDDIPSKLADTQNGIYEDRCVLSTVDVSLIMKGKPETELKFTLKFAETLQVHSAYRSPIFQPNISKVHPAGRTQPYALNRRMNNGVQLPMEQEQDIRFIAELVLYAIQ
jgi:hypothetical protein